MNRVKNNLPTLLRYFLVVWSALSAFASLWLSFLTWDDMGIVSKAVRVLILLAMASVAIVSATITVIARKQKRIFGDPNRGVILQYGDILKIGFPKKSVPKRIVVIPVNRCFDLSFENGLVSRKTVHGQWIESFIRSDKDRDQVSADIQEFLLDKGAMFNELTPAQKKAGNLKRYSPGTVVELEGQDGITFYLLALSAFDQNLKAHCSEHEFFEALQGLVEYYDAHGQGEDMYCPVMGDHIVRPTRETNDMISLILSFLRFNKGRIHGNIHLVVYEKMKGDVPILRY